jgi:small GTP-binding protein
MDDVISKKVCMLGDFAVGKTSLVRRFVEGRFDDRYLSTIGVKISRKTVELAEKTWALILWDLAGGNGIDRMLPSYLQGVAAALVVCDLTRRATLDVCPQYHRHLQQANPAAPVLVVGNKLDLDAERVVPDSDLAQVCAQYGWSFTLTSAKTGHGVEDLFRQIAVQFGEE